MKVNKSIKKTYEIFFGLQSFRPLNCMSSTTSLRDGELASSFLNVTGSRVSTPSSGMPRANIGMAAAVACLAHLASPRLHFVINVAKIRSKVNFISYLFVIFAFSFYKTQTQINLGDRTRRMMETNTENEIGIRWLVQVPTACGTLQ